MTLKSSELVDIHIQNFKLLIQKASELDITIK